MHIHLAKKIYIKEKLYIYTRIHDLGSPVPPPPPPIAHSWYLLRLTDSQKDK